MGIPEEGVHCTAGAQSSARGVRAARTMTPWRGDDACTVALAALAGRFGAVRALGATTCLLRLGALGARREQSELGERPRAPRRRAHSQHPRPSLVAAAPAARPPAREAPLLLEKQSPGSQVRAGELRAARAGLETVSVSGLSLGPPGGELSPGTFSQAPWRPAPASARPWRLPQAALASLLLPSRPPASHAPSPARVRLP